ncbi:MAG: TetR family transcriptional regulator [Thermoleophilaceae bacterium]
MPGAPSDLSSPARIRNAALELFAFRGVAATTIRDIAAAAGVSPGMVQHHFKTKAGLRSAVDEYAIAVFAQAFDGVGESDDALDIFQDLAARLTALVSDSPLPLRYIARSVIDGDDAGLATFDRLVGVGDGLVAQLADQGYLRPDTDLRWVALHNVMLNLATVLLEPGISRHLTRDLRSPEEIRRWSEATTALFAHGILADSERTPPPR